MTETNTLPEKPMGSKQLTNQALQAMARPHAIRAIQRLVELIESKNEPVAISASKTLLAKVLPDLKSETLQDESGNTYKILLDMPGVRLVKNANNTIQSAGELPAETTTGV